MSGQSKRNLTFNTPDNKHLRLSEQMSTPPLSQLSEVSTSAYKTRTDRFKNMLSYNETLESRGQFEPSKVTPYGFRVQLTQDSESMENVTQRYRYMYTSLEERARALDKQLLKIQNSMCLYTNMEEDQLKPVGMPSQDMVWICGRVVNEALEGKLNSTSILIEGSRKESGGRRVKLELKDITTYSLFPGQIVLIEGVTSQGRIMVAKRVIEGIPRPLIQSEPSKLLEYHYSKDYQNGLPINVIIASGPFTINDNLSYDPLRDLISRVLKSKPDVVILIGPFVDITQPLLENGDIILNDLNDEDQIIGQHEASYEMIFIERIVRDTFTLMFNAEDDFGINPTQFVLIPSLSDAHHDFVYPQPPFGDRNEIKTNFFEEPIGVLNIPGIDSNNKNRNRVHLMSNPCMFK